jgi:zinc transport system permease protein
LLAQTVSFDLARAEGMDVERARLVFMLLMAALVAVAMKIVGILLITALLIIPAASARRFARSPEEMVFGAALIGILAVLAGLFASLGFDTPSGPSIVVAALGLFLAMQAAAPLKKVLTKGAGPS